MKNVLSLFSKNEDFGYPDIKSSVSGWPAEWQAFFKDEERKNMAKIKSSAKQLGLRRSMQIYKGLKILTYSKNRGFQIAPDVMENMYLECKTLNPMGMMGKCFSIAEAALSREHSDFIIGTGESAANFLHRNHYINLSVLPDNSLLSYDLTASDYIDMYQGNLNIFCVHGDDIGSLTESLDLVYGGQWHVFDDAEITARS